MVQHNTETGSIDVGTRLRQIRKERGMSMRALGRASGLSTNALSMIERGRTSPSVSTLYKLADALKVPITAFFHVLPERKDIVFREASERTRISFAHGLWEGLGGEMFSGRVEPFMLTLNPGATSGEYPMAHSGHEFVLCLEGVLEYEVEGEKFLLRPGNTLLFAARLEHRWRNAADQTTRAMFVLAGFETYEQPGELHYSA